MTDITITVEEITPQVASAMLQGNDNNRRTAQTRLETYARDMRSKKWKVTGDPIKFNGKRLLDGQHRLQACILANTAFTTAVARGISETAHAAIDVGYGRTLGHELRWQGEKDYALLAASLGLLYVYDEDTRGYDAPSRNELLQVLKKNPGLRRSIDMTKGTVSKAPGLHRTSLVIVHYLIEREHNAELADRYVAEVLAGTGYEEGDPTLMLRTYAANMARQRMNRPGGIDWLAIQVKAANSWLTGRPIKALSWRRVGPSKENFPQIATSEEVGL